METGNRECLQRETDEQIRSWGKGAWSRRETQRRGVRALPEPHRRVQGRPCQAVQCACTPRGLRRPPQSTRPEQRVLRREAICWPAWPRSSAPSTGRPTWAASARPHSPLHTPVERSHAAAAAAAVGPAVGLPQTCRFPPFSLLGTAPHHVTARTAQLTGGAWHPEPPGSPGWTGSSKLLRPSDSASARLPSVPRPASPLLQGPVSKDRSRSPSGGARA